MFYLYLAAGFVNVLLLSITPWTGIPAWFPIASGALCCIGAYNHRARPLTKPKRTYRIKK